LSRKHLIALIELEEAFVSSRQDMEFIREFDQLMALLSDAHTVDLCKTFVEKLGGAHHLKRRTWRTGA
jgi:tryptophan synthase beta subunit